MVAPPNVRDRVDHGRERQQVIGNLVVTGEGGELRLVPLSETQSFTPTIERVIAALDQLLQEASTDPARAVVVMRSLNALAQEVPRLTRADLRDAGSAATDRDVLITALLVLAGEPASAPAPDPLAEARLRGEQAQRALLGAEGGPLLVSAVAERLHLTRQAVDRRRKAGRLLALRSARHGYLYPAWQFTDQGLLPGLEEVLGQLRAGGHDPWMQLAFFLNGRDDLDGHRPLDALRNGDLDAVTRAARRYGTHGGA